MLRQSPRRNQKAAADGFKVKHALQVFLLLAICMWLLYQVGHGKQEREDAVGDEGQGVKFGRKELRPRPETGNGEEQEDEPGEDFEEMEAEGRGGGDDEIDGNDQEASEEGGDAADELVEDKVDKETEDRDYLPRDASSAVEDGNKDEAMEDRAGGFLPEHQKGNAGSDAKFSL